MLSDDEHQIGGRVVQHPIRLIWGFKPYCISGNQCLPQELIVSSLSPALTRMRNNGV
jgi:hypothetical protein